MKKFWSGLGWTVICGLIVLVAFLIQLVASVVAVLPFSILMGLEIAQNQITDPTVIAEMTAAVTEKSMPVALVASHLLLVLVFALWYRFGLKKTILKGAKSVLTGKTVLVAALLAFGMGCATNFALPLWIQILPQSSVEYYEYLMESAAIGVSLLSNIAAILVAPIGEELVFRGVIFAFAEKAVAKMNNKRYAFWIANAIQAFMFGAFHGNFVQGSYAFVMGLGFGYLAKRYNNILPCILGHMVVNGSSLLIWNNISGFIPENNIVYAIGAAVFIAVCVIALKMGGASVNTEEAVAE